MAKFEPGQVANPAGRPKDSPNKRSLKALEIALEHKVCPITFWCNVVNDKYPEADFDHKMAAMKELAPYIYAKLKQIEHTGGGDLTEMFAKLFGGNANT